MIMRTQRSYRIRDKKTKRQRRNIAGRWAASKGGEGNDLADNDGKGDRKGARK